MALPWFWELSEAESLNRAGEFYFSTMKEHDIYGLYADSWNGEIVAEAFAHPAKFSRGLIRYIYQHAIEQDYIKRGDKILDCFGGVALGGLEAMLNGMHWRGVELEEKFVQLGQANIDLWQSKYGGWFQLGTAQLLQGDSRRLVEVIGAADGVISSPPYADAISSSGHGLDLSKSAAKHDRTKHNNKSLNGLGADYGSTPGQLGSMKEGDFTAVISSPPFGEAETRNRSDYQPGRVTEMMKRAYLQDSQGTTDGNLATMRATDEGFEACVSSPPFESSLESKDTAFQALARPGRTIQCADYGDTPGNIGNNQGETFWTAARQIVEQVYQVLKPGGVAIWVCGDFVRNRQRVYFGRQWLQLCEACGFEPLEWIRAWKTEHNGTQLGLFGEDKELRTDRVSFFRRLANEKNPSAAILNEDIIIVQKI